MENNKDYEKRLGRRLREAYLKDYEGPAMSRENFHRLIEAAEKKKNHNKAMIGLAAACVAICLVCGGFIAGMSMRESASAGKDDETKAVQQGDSVVIGSGVSENDQNVGVSTKTYTDIEDIPEDLREQIHFLDSDEFELEKVKAKLSKDVICVVLYYDGKERITIDETFFLSPNNIDLVLHEPDRHWEYEGTVIYMESTGESVKYSLARDEQIFCIRSDKEIKQKEIEAIFYDLIIN